MTDKKNSLGDTVIKKDVVQTTVILNTPFANEAEMVEAVKSHMEFKSMIPEDDSGDSEGEV